MNALEQAVIAQRRRRLWRVRGAAMLAVAIVTFAALWAAGVVDQVWWRSWFGAEQAVPAPMVASPTLVVNPATQEQTTSQFADDGAVGRLRLVATQPGRNAREGTAQIATGRANPLTYIAGALLGNGTLLIEVHPDHVVLQRDTATTRLYVDGAERSSKSDPVREKLITVEAPGPKSNKPRPEQTPETFANLMRAAPRFVDTEIIGFEVYSGIDTAVLSRLNLQPGDVVIEMDGTAVTTVEQLHRSLKAISSGASVMVTVLRGSEQLIITLDGATLKSQPSEFAVLPP